MINQIRIMTTRIFLFMLIISTVSHSQIVYVDINAQGLNDGSTWENACNILQDGIDRAELLDGQVWVAQGTYFENIVLDGNVSIWGGFVGIETTLNQRNYKLNRTIIDGLNRNRVIHFYGNNIVDGFTIINGFTDYTSVEVHPGRGAGILTWYASGIIRNNWFAKNIGERGGGIFMEGGEILLEYNVFTKNIGSVCAGGVEMHNSPSIVRYNTIVDNIGFGLEIPTNTPIVLGDFYNNIVDGNLFNEHSRFSGPPRGKDVWAWARGMY